MMALGQSFSISVTEKIAYPSAADYSRGVADALYALDKEYVTNRLSPPVAAHVSVLRAGIEAALDQSLDTLVSVARGQLDAKASTIVSLVGELLAGTAEVVSSVMSEAAKQGLIAAETAAGAAAMIPAIGQTVGIVIQGIASYFQREEQLENLRTKLDVALVNACAARISAIANDQRPRAGGVDRKYLPSDLFRNVLYVHQSRQKQIAQGYAPTTPLPLDQGSMYVLMCGAQSQGYGFTEQKYAEFRSYANSVSATKPGMDVATQRKAWAAIKGIMGMITPPDIPPPDGGVSVMPILQDILYNEWQRGTWDIRYLQAINGWLCGLYLSGSVTVYPEGGGAIQKIISCRGQYVDLASPFFESIMDWAKKLNETPGMFKDAQGNWKIPRPSAKPVLSKAILTLGPQLTLKTGSEIKSAYDKANERKQAEETRKGLIAGASVLAAGGAFIGMRRLARRRRRRT